MEEFINWLMDILNCYDICTIKIIHMDNFDCYSIIKIKDYLLIVGDIEYKNIKREVFLNNVLGKIVFIISIIVLVVSFYMIFNNYEYLSFFSFLFLLFIICPILFFGIPPLTCYIGKKINQKYIINDSKFNKDDFDKLTVKIKKINEFSNIIDFTNVNKNNLNKYIDYEKYILTQEDYLHIMSSEQFIEELKFNIETIKLIVEISDQFKVLDSLKEEELNIAKQINLEEHISDLQNTEDRLFDKLNIGCQGSVTKEDTKKKIIETQTMLKEKRQMRINELNRKVKAMKEEQEKKEMEEKISREKQKEEAILKLIEIQKLLSDDLNKNELYMKFITNFIKKEVLHQRYRIFSMLRLGTFVNRISYFKIEELNTCKNVVSNMDVFTPSIRIKSKKQLDFESIHYLEEQYIDLDKIMRKQFRDIYSKYTGPIHHYGEMCGISDIKSLDDSMHYSTLYERLFNELINVLNNEFEEKFKNLIERFDDTDEILNEIVKTPYINNRYENYDLLISYNFVKKGKDKKNLQINDLIKEYDRFIAKILEVEKKYEEEKKLEDYKKELLIDNDDSYYLISDIDKMSGVDFEKFLIKLFSNMKYQCKHTKLSQDQGLDLIIEKDGETIGIQAKRYSSNVGNKAIQEVIAGSQFYKCNRCIVVTNSYFTKQAKELAQKTKVILWDRDKLSSLLIEYPTKK